MAANKLTLQLEVHKAWWLAPAVQALTLLARMGIYSEHMTRAVLERGLTVRAK